MHINDVRTATQCKPINAVSRPASVNTRRTVIDDQLCNHSAADVKTKQSVCMH